MAEIVNLRMARKARSRAEREAGAAANRAAHGIPLHERKLARAERERLAKAVDSARREPEDR